MKPLENCRITLGITGSISAYKAAYLARLLIKAGAAVRTVMTSGAERFIGALTFEAITGAAVLTQKSESWTNDINHIGIAKWTELFIIAPASVNTINKIASGAADNPLLQTFIACKAPKIIAPAANSAMIENAVTKQNIEKLKAAGIIFVDSAYGFLACGEEGIGRLAATETIYYKACRSLLNNSFWQKRTVIVTGGGTKEPIDDVRVIGNLSSGKTALGFAKAAFFLGAKVYMIGNIKDEFLPIEYIEADTVNKIKEALDLTIEKESGGEKKAFLFMAAAVGDYTAVNKTDGKIKKESIGESWHLALKQSEDILSAIDKTNLYTVGFKAETDPLGAYNSAIKMKSGKKLDAVCLNVIGDTTSFGGNETKIKLIAKNEAEFIGDKLSVAYNILLALQSEFA
ncbi:MAG: bifunctional phosphopantothenoylcysteine decarboxylase/phosphopantothenate--cysteine ligase CoaBC [Helicobacteraceae bacterium]|jgi:phosphopantothenoylcysteine decarboxylase/phosphopantothenate--cysteine ligase|nr:bifunctional phosphopantothenoylcysteine decarboxylase/phosphopantothenate--cysteine ligase CoaBC [Helicobacteraceae bacterium]